MTHNVLPCALHECELAFLTSSGMWLKSETVCFMKLIRIMPVFGAKETLIIHASGNNLPSVLLEGEQAFPSMACQGQQQQPV